MHYENLERRILQWNKWNDSVNKGYGKEAEAQGLPELEFGEISNIHNKLWICTSKLAKLKN